MLTVTATLYPASYTQLQDSAWIARVGDATYYAFVSLVQFGDPGPVTGLGKGATLAIKLTGIVYVAVVVGLVVSSVLGSGTSAASGDGVKVTRDAPVAQDRRPRNGLLAILAGGLVVVLYIIRALGR